MFSGTTASAWRGPQPRSENAHIGKKVPETNPIHHAGRAGAVHRLFPIRPIAL